MCLLYIKICIIRRNYLENGNIILKIYLSLTILRFILSYVPIRVILKQDPQTVIVYYKKNKTLETQVLT